MQENDAMSVSIFMPEIQQKPFDPILIYKPLGMTKEEYLTIVGAQGISNGTLQKNLQ